MELKKFNDYTAKEQKELLLHWYFYYGKIPVNLQEIQTFESLVDKNPRQIMEIAVASYIIGMTSEGLVMAIRNNQFDELLGTLPNLADANERFMRRYQSLENALLSELIKTYNNQVNGPVSVFEPIDIDESTEPNQGKKREKIKLKSESNQNE